MSDGVGDARLEEQMKRFKLTADTNVAAADTLERRLRKLESQLDKLQLEKSIVIDANVRKLNTAW